MLHINKTSNQDVQGLQGLDLVIAALKIAVLVGITMFANSIGTILGQLYVFGAGQGDFTNLMVSSRS